MSDNDFGKQMDQIIDLTKDSLIDSFADLVRLLNERRYDDAALQSHALAYGLSLFSRGLATEALARRLEQPLDKPDEQ